MTHVPAPRRRAAAPPLAHRPRPARPAARRPARPPAAAARTSGLVLYGVSLAMMVRGDLGLAPWDVLHSGLTRHVPLTLGQAIVADELRGAAAVDPAAGDARPRHDRQRARRRRRRRRDARAAGRARTRWWLRVALMLGGVVLNGLATALYIGAQLGRGPRDGLMTGLRPAHRPLAAAGAHRARGHRGRASACCSAAWPGSARCSTRSRSGRWPS